MQIAKALAYRGTLAVLLGCAGCGSGGDDDGQTLDDAANDGADDTATDTGDTAIGRSDAADSGGAVDAPDTGLHADGASSDTSGAGDTAASDAASDGAKETADASKGPRPGACVPTVTAPTPDVQTARPKGTTCAALGYYEYVPAGYDSASNWPVIIAFHGDGERGNGTTDLPLLLNNGLTSDIPKGKWDPKKRFVVLAPQMDDRGSVPERGAASVDAFVKFAKANYDVDVKRIYLTGLSGGGAPVYNYLGTYSGGEVAATNINAGWYSTQGKECSWKDIPIWYFHSDMDTTVPAPEHTTKSYDTLIGCTPGPKVAPRYTMYAGMGHGAWGPTYDLTGMDATKYPLVKTPPGTTPYDISLYDWFLKYSR